MHVVSTRSSSSGVWAMIRSPLHPQRGRSGKPAGGHVRKLARQTDGEMREQTEWHRVVLFGKLAEVAGEYLRKGAQVYIEGNSVPVAGKITVSPVTSLKFLLRPRAPCRCWDVHHSRTLRRNRSLSRMGSHRVLTRRKRWRENERPWT